MAIFHLATLTPTKAEILAAWLPAQPWGPSPQAEIDLLGSYRIDDPNGRVGLECHLATDGTDTYHVPLTYREQPLDGLPDQAEALVAEMEHSVLGPRWVYDGLRDPLMVTMLAGVTLTGQGEALGLVVSEGRAHIAPAAVRISGGGWAGGPVAVDGLVTEDGSAQSPVFSNDRFALTIHRRPRPASASDADAALVAAWRDQSAVVTEIELHPT